MIRAVAMCCLLLLLQGCSEDANAQKPSGLEPYSKCTFSNAFRVRQVDHPPKSGSRQVKTKDGMKSVDIEDGYQVLISYKTQPFVNLKAEQFGSVAYDSAKAILIDLLVNVSAAEELESKTPLQTRMGAFDVYGINRKQVEGGVLGIYALFHQGDTTVVTIYFLNEKPGSRKFQTIAEYRVIRDDFLKQYTACLSPPPQSSK